MFKRFAPQRPVLSSESFGYGNRQKPFEKDISIQVIQKTDPGCLMK